MSTQHLGVIEARNQLPDLVRRITETPNISFTIGRYRRSDAMLVSPTTHVPPDVQQLLLDGFWAGQALRAVAGNPETADGQRPPLVGPDVGTVTAWMWDMDPGAAARRVNSYIEDLRDVADDPNLADQVLDELRASMPPDFERRKFDALREQVRRETDAMLRGGRRSR